MVNRIVLFLWLILFGFVHAHAAIFHGSENHIWEFFNAGYDAVCRANTGYDGSEKLSSAYDVALSRAQTDDERRTEERRTSFALIARLLAAKGAELVDDAAKLPVGRLGNPMKVPGPQNTPTTIGGREFSGHALDQMQGRGFMPSVVENTIQRGTTFSTRVGTTGYFDSVNRVRVITDAASGRVVTVIPGAP